ncbi:MAG: acyltransferase [Oscillospiraceae bacterium]|nr:acyltransferase [Oscillospiraceae bacterium]
MAGKTDYRFKFLYALGMYAIVFAHTNGEGPTLLFDWFSSFAFAVPLFIFCSGYFYRDESGRNIPAYVARKAKILLVPLYLWNFFYALVVLVTRRFGFTIGLMPDLRNLFLMPLIDGSQFEFNMASWFVAPLFMTEVCNALLRKLFSPSGSRRRECAVFTGYVLLGMLGVWLSNLHIRGYWMVVLVRLLFFLPFYGLGIFYRRVLEDFDRLPDLPYFALCFLAQYLLVVIVGHFPSYTFSRLDNLNDGLLTPFIAGAIGIAFWLRAARLVEPTLARDRWVNAVADNSFSIMENHLLGFMLVKGGFALLKAATPFCQSFDMEQFKSNLVYYYTPGGRVFMIFYIAAGFVLPILMQKAVDLVKRRLKKA